jgi:hypothetical protein
MWTGLYAAFGAAATVAARRAAAKVWRVATGEEPPTKR